MQGYEPNTPVNHHYVRFAGLPGGEVFWGSSGYYRAIAIHCRKFWGTPAEHLRREYLAVYFAV